MHIFIWNICAAHACVRTWHTCKVNVPTAYTFVRKNEQRACICKQTTYISMSIYGLQPWAPHKQMHVYHCEWHCPDMDYSYSNKSNI
eukprot:4941024-Pleurochrysis_carterae.AAC.3